MILHREITPCDGAHKNRSIYCHIAIKPPVRPSRHFRLRNDLYCVEWGVKLYSLTPSRHSIRDFATAPHCVTVARSRRDLDRRVRTWRRHFAAAELRCSDRRTGDDISQSPRTARLRRLPTLNPPTDRPNGRSHVAFRSISDLTRLL